MQVIPQRPLRKRPSHLQDDPGAAIAPPVQRHRPQLRVLPEAESGIDEDDQIRSRRIPHHLLPILGRVSGRPIQPHELFHPPCGLVVVLVLRPHGIQLVKLVVVGIHRAGILRSGRLMNDERGLTALLQILADGRHEVCDERRAAALPVGARCIVRLPGGLGTLRPAHACQVPVHRDVAGDDDFLVRVRFVHLCSPNDSETRCHASGFCDFPRT
jgi:hypothetical protein